MHSHRETQHSPYTPEQLFALVSDVERYPEFIPWCRAARILERGEGQFLGELMISFANISESYVSRVTLTPHSAIDVSLVRGPFKKLSNHWRFTPKAEGGTQIDFSLEFEFRSRLLETLIGALFSRATAKMVAAFSTRADALYGAKR
ncbi:MAG: type II toxin-antitoxin system RatA family toxin [Alphaproteobacteria bacterium]|nr:type II toxin-antitoxin system RatA family toxin [Alphaproteobacteria bacterium]